MTTTKLTKDQQFIVDFCESHEDIEYTIEDNGYGVSVSAKTIQENWTDGIFSIQLLASYSSGRARQYVSVIEVAVFTDARTEDIKLKDIYRELNSGWKHNTKSGREERQREIAAWKEMELA